MEPEDTPPLQQKESIQQASEVDLSKPQRKPLNKKMLILAGLLFVGAVIVIFVSYKFLSNQTDNKVLKTVNGENITQSDLDKRLAEVFNPSDIQSATENKEIVDNLIDDLTKEKLIEIEARERGITVSDVELDAAMNDQEKGNSAARSLYHRTLLEEKIKKSVVASRTVNILTSYKEPDLPNFGELAALTSRSMELVKEDMMTNNMSMIEAFEIEKTGPDFDERISYRGDLLAYPDTLPKAIFEEILTLSVGEVSDVLYDDAGTFMMVQIVESNNSEFLSFDEWLSSALNNIK